jgi:hypothetical protein
MGNAIALNGSFFNSPRTASPEVQCIIEEGRSDVPKATPRPGLPARLLGLP